MQLNQTSAEKIMADMHMGDIPLVSVRPTPVAISRDWFTQYRAARHRFMTGLGDAIEELAILNLDQAEFMALLTGNALPAGMSIRMRIPMAWGGKIDADNMFMCRTFPHSHNMDRFILSQSGNDMIWLPNPARKVYVPAHTASGGDGGNATEDRLSQIAAQIASSRAME